MDDLFLYYGVLFLAISLYFIGYYCKILGDFVTHKEYNKISKNYINYLLRLLFVICVIGCGFIMIYKDEFLIYFSHIALPIYCIFINSIMLIHVSKFVKNNPKRDKLLDSIIYDEYRYNDIPATIIETQFNNKKNCFISYCKVFTAAFLVNTLLSVSIVCYVTYYFWF